VNSDLRIFIGLYRLLDGNAFRFDNRARDLS
jgi:hypothetical protein